MKFAYSIVFRSTLQSIAYVVAYCLAVLVAAGAAELSDSLINARVFFARCYTRLIKSACTARLKTKSAPVASAKTKSKCISSLRARWPRAKPFGFG